MTEQMAEEKLVKQIGKAIIGLLSDGGTHSTWQWGEFVLSIVKQDGYLSPEEVTALLAKAREGWVQLADDQSYPLELVDTIDNEDLSDVLAGWRKIKQE